MSRRLLISVHDLIVTALAVVASIFARSDASGVSGRTDWLVVVIPCMLVIAAGVYWYFELSRPKWRFFSLPDLHHIVVAATAMTAAVLAIDYILLAEYVYGTFFFGKVTIALYWFFQIAFLAGPRVAYRYFRYTRTQNRAKHAKAMPALVVGVSADVEVFLRGVESGAVQKIRPVGILSPSGADQRQAVRGIPILGRPADFEDVVRTLETNGQNIGQLILTPSAMAAEVHPESLVMRARRLAISPRTVRVLPESGEHLAVLPINVEDLLLRPSADIDYGRLQNFIKDNTVAVTGGGGSIGAEICDRVVTFGASKLLVLENSEPALHAVMERLATKNAKTQIEGRIADVRDRERMFNLLGEFRPDLVFHAAALKHVPILERDWEEGVKTNIFGSVIVADAAVAAGAQAMVMISTDKAIEAVSILGATKRFAEMYCQALDIELAEKAKLEGKKPTRIVSVRFGNVLASNGSVVPKFKAQIEAGGPVTVTHPEMIRYFMTIREACDLVVTASSHALSAINSSVGVYVLNMGQPVKVVDLAERMIRLAGLEPGQDIEIVFTGVRPGERLSEILFGQEESTSEIGLPGIMAAAPERLNIATIRSQIELLESAIKNRNHRLVMSVLQQAAHKLGASDDAVKLQVGADEGLRTLN